MAARSLDPREQRRLVNALLEISILFLPSTRDSCISVLQRKLVRPLYWERHEEAYYDLWGLVDACMERPGALHVLLEAVEDLNNDGLALQRARTIVNDLLPEPLLTTQERKDLGELVQRLESHELDLVERTRILLAFQLVVGPSGPAPTLAEREGRFEIDVQLLIEDLERAPMTQGGVAPLLLFVQHLADYATDLTRTAFTEWASEFAGRLGVGAHWRALLPRIPAALPQFGEGGPEAFLVIDCRPDGPSADQFITVVTLEQSDGPGIRLHCDERPRPVEALPDLIERLLAQEAVRLAALSTPTLEFVLPLELLTLPCDQFLVTIDRIQRRLGVQYPVVLRSQYRLENERLWPDWRRKWERVRDSSGSAEVCPLFEQGDYDGERLFSLLSDPAAVAVAMGYPPSDVGDADGTDELWVALHAGVPIIVWCRECRVPKRFADEVHALFGSDLRSLPRRVQELRRQAVANPDSLPQSLPQGGGLTDEVDEATHLGLHLALLFDDADRVPEPYERLKPPA